jgi:hypothetical protein
MLMKRLAIIFAVVLGLSACQSIAGKPSISAMAILESDGFKPGEASDLNKDITKDDIVTVASYECERPRCKKDVIVLFGVDPNASKFAEEFKSLLTGNNGAKQKLLQLIVGKEFSSHFTGLSSATFVTPERGIGIRINGRVKRSKLPSALSGQQFYLGMVYLYRNNQGRVIASIANDRATANRYLSLNLLK